MRIIFIEPKEGKRVSNNRILYFARNVSYTVASNVFKLFVSAATVLVLPKLIGIESYGYYQLYLFYMTYAGVAMFGWCNGIYLRLGGKYYEELNKPLYSTQFWLLGIFELFIYVFILIVALAMTKDTNKQFVYVCICTAAIAFCLREYFTSLFQATARIKEYAFVTIFEYVALAVFMIILMGVGYRKYYLIIICDVVSKYMSMLLGAWYCRDLVLCNRFVKFSSIVEEIKENISAGIKIMLSGLCSMLIIGVTRFCVGLRWDVSTFGKVSLTFSISNMVVVAINAIAVVIYPMLRRTEVSKLVTIYNIIRVLLISIILGGIIFYQPVQVILTIWLPKYSESLKYAAILLPMCIYESKMSMLMSTYFKVLRLEKTMMKCNLLTLIVSTFCSFFSVFLLSNVIMAIITILISLIFRGILSEIILSHHININVKKDIVLELIMTMVFIICNWFYGFWGMLFYATCYVLYLVIKRKDIISTLHFLKSL